MVYLILHRIYVRYYEIVDDVEGRKYDVVLKVNLELLVNLYATPLEAITIN